MLCEASKSTALQLSNFYVTKHATHNNIQCVRLLTFVPRMTFSCRGSCPTRLLSKQNKLPKKPNLMLQHFMLSSLNTNKRSSKNLFFLNKACSTYDGFDQIHLIFYEDFQNMVSCPMLTSTTAKTGWPSLC